MNKPTEYPKIKKQLAAIQKKQEEITKIQAACQHDFHNDLKSSQDSMLTRTFWVLQTCKLCGFKTSKDIPASDRKLYEND